MERRLLTGPAWAPGPPAGTLRREVPVRVRAQDQSGAAVVIGAGKTGAVVAFDAQSGKLLWRTKVGKHMHDELTEFPAQ